MPGTGPDRRARCADSRRRGRALCAIAAASAAGWVGGCGSGDHSDGLIHLDPRLEDGRSSAEVLSHAASVIEARFGPDAVESSGPWRVTAGIPRSISAEGGVALARGMRNAASGRSRTARPSKPPRSRSSSSTCACPGTSI